MCGALSQDEGGPPGDQPLIRMTSVMEPDLSVDDVVVTLGEATPRRLLRDWANSPDAWVRRLTAESIVSRQAPTVDLSDSVYAVFLAEEGLSDEELASVSKLRSPIRASFPPALLARGCHGHPRHQFTGS